MGLGKLKGLWMAGLITLFLVAAGAREARACGGCGCCCCTPCCCCCCCCCCCWCEPCWCCEPWCCWDSGPYYPRPARPSRVPSYLYPPGPSASYSPAPSQVASSSPQKHYKPTTFSIEVPADAVVVINDIPTKSTGAHRSYKASRLEEGMDYDFTIRASVKRNGHVYEDTRVVRVTAGEQKNLSMTLLAGTTVTQIAARR